MTAAIRPEPCVSSCTHVVHTIDHPPANALSSTDTRYQNKFLAIEHFQIYAGPRERMIRTGDEHLLSGVRSRRGHAEATF